MRIQNSEKNVLYFLIPICLNFIRSNTRWCDIHPKLRSFFSVTVSRNLYNINTNVPRGTWNESIRSKKVKLLYDDVNVLFFISDNEDVVFVHVFYFVFICLWCTYKIFSHMRNCVTILSKIKKYSYSFHKSYFYSQTFYVIFSTLYLVEVI